MIVYLYVNIFNFEKTLKDNGLRLFLYVVSNYINYIIVYIEYSSKYNNYINLDSK